MNIVEIATIGLQQDNERLRMLSHNIANITTAGFKRQVAVQGSFSDAVQAELAARTAMGTHADLSAGKLRVTGNPLDIALQAREYLVVRGAAGETALSRGGALQLDATGRLLAPGGFVVQGAHGDLSLPITAGEVHLDSNGQVHADGRPVGALRVVRLADDVSPTPLGNGLFELREAADAQDVSAPRVHAGHTEASNVVASQEMVQLMATVRHAESMARLIQGADELLEKSIRKLGEI
jgi:flagellar basal-body rod protein FlgF